MSDRKILMALVTGPHGLQGAVKLKTFTENPLSLFAYSPLFDEKGVICNVSLVRHLKDDMIIANVNHTTTRNGAEQLRGLKIFVNRSDLPLLEAEEFYHEDLLGLPIYDEEGGKVGVLKAILNHGAGDFLDIIGENASEGRCTIPFTKLAVPEIYKDRIVICRAFLLLSDFCPS